MHVYQKNKDPFLDFIGDATPLKKSKKITKKHDLADIKKYGIIKTESSVYEVNSQLKRKSSLFFDGHRKVYADSFISNDQVAFSSKS